MDGLPEPLCTLYKACIHNDVEPKRSEIDNVFQEVLSVFKEVFLVMDALDECEKESRDDLVNYLGRLPRSSSCKLKIFIASRREVDIECNILSAKFAVLPIEVEKVDDDIATYVDHELKNRTDCTIGKALKGVIRDRLMAQANGM